MSNIQEQMAEICVEMNNNMTDIFDLEERIRQDKSDIKVMKKDNRFMRKQLKRLIKALEKEND